jgi:dTDP-4-amino-4,6-dideoxygalactose transaminase
MNNKPDYRYIPIKKGYINKLYPWYLWVIDFWVLLLKINVSKTQKIKNYLKELFKTNYIYFFDSGKSALVIALMALDIKKGDDVCVSVFVCPDVIESIVTVKANPIFVDCEDDFLINVVDLKNKITKKTKCIITTNTYGFTEKDEIYRIAEENNIRTISDLAQTLKIIDHGDISVYSVGPQKILNTTGGGILISKEKNLSEKIQSIMPNEYVSYGELVLMFLNRIKYYLTFFLLKYIKIIYISKEKKQNDYNSSNIIKPKMMSNRTIYSIYFKIKNYGVYQTKIKHKINKLNKCLEKFNWIKTPKSDTNSINLYYTILLRDGLRYKLGLYLAEHGFQSTWNYIPVSWYLAYKNYYNETPNAFKLSEQVLSLPFMGLSNHEIEKMISIIENFEKELL